MSFVSLNTGQMYTISPPEDSGYTPGILRVTDIIGNYIECDIIEGVSNSRVSRIIKFRKQSAFHKWMSVHTVLSSETIDNYLSRVDTWVDFLMQGE